jgi:hypothetical protein
VLESEELEIAVNAADADLPAREGWQFLLATGFRPEVCSFNTVYLYDWSRMADEAWCGPDVVDLAAPIMLRGWVSGRAAVAAFAAFAEWFMVLSATTRATMWARHAAARDEGGG